MSQRQIPRPICPSVTACLQFSVPSIPAPIDPFHAAALPSPRPSPFPLFFIIATGGTWWPQRGARECPRGFELTKSADWISCRSACTAGLFFHLRASRLSEDVGCPPWFPGLLGLLEHQPRRPEGGQTVCDASARVLGRARPAWVSSRGAEGKIRAGSGRSSLCAARRSPSFWSCGEVRCVPPKPLQQLSRTPQARTHGHANNTGASPQQHERASKREQQVN